MKQILLLVGLCVFVAVFAPGCIYSYYSYRMLDESSSCRAPLDEYVVVEEDAIVFQNVELHRERTILYSREFRFFRHDGELLYELLCRSPTLWLELPFMQVNEKKWNDDVRVPGAARELPRGKVRVTQVYKDGTIWGPFAIRDGSAGGGEAVVQLKAMGLGSRAIGSLSLYAEVKKADEVLEILLFDDIAYKYCFRAGRFVYLFSPRWDMDRAWYFGIPSKSRRYPIMWRIDVLTGEKRIVAYFNNAGCFVCESSEETELNGNGH